MKDLDVVSNALGIVCGIDWHVTEDLAVDNVSSVGIRELCGRPIRVLSARPTDL